jgi:tripartite-type tricarboxylate transporter receptor subunit TctC
MRTPARVSNVQELIAIAKKRPGDLTYSSSGIGTGTHLSGELLGYCRKLKFDTFLTRAALDRSQN